MNADDLVLYRFFDAEGGLLYIGKAVNVWRRLREHERSRVHREAASVTFQRGFRDEDALLAAEAAAIRGGGCGDSR